MSSNTGVLGDSFRVSKPRPRRSAVSSTVRRQQLIFSIRRLDCEMPIPCSYCAHKARRCLVGAHSAKCAECLEAGRSECDMGVEKSDWEKIRVSREKLRSKLRAAEETEMAAAAKKHRLLRQLALLDDRQGQLYLKELALIEQLEKAEAKEKETETSSPTGPLAISFSPSASVAAD